MFTIPMMLRRLALVSMGVLVISVVVYAAESKVTQEITANIMDAIEITGPGPYSWNDLVVGTNTSAPQTITVRSTASYDIKIHSVTRTKMAEYDIATTTYITGGQTLQTALQWKTENGTPVPISRTDVPVASALPATSDSGAGTAVAFVQQVGYGDRRLPSGKTYRIEVVYTATQTL